MKDIRKLREKYKNAGTIARQLCKRLSFCIHSNDAVRESELYDSCILLKNLALVYRQMPLSADMILELLMENSWKLKPVYREVLNLYRNGKRQEAFSFFASAVGTKSGRSFSAILAKLDQINPAELLEQMKVFQNMMAEKRMTQAVRKAQKNSWLTTIWSTATLFALMINFVIVTVLLDTLQVLKNVF